MEIKEDSRLLFMKYALPCAGTLVKRGQVAQKDVDRLINIVKNGGKIPKDVEKIFKVAFSACSLLAIDRKKNNIDSDVIREYFLRKHDDVIDKRHAEMGDFDPESCRIRIGSCESVENGFATVITSQGKKKYRTDFITNPRKNDIVITHWDFIVEKKTKKKLVKG